MCAYDHEALDNDNAAGNCTLFYVSAFYAFHIDQCHLQTLQIDPHFHDSPEEVGIVEVLKILWPLKLLQGRTEIDISAFPVEAAIKAFEHASEVDETMIEASNIFARFFISKETENDEDSEAMSGCAWCTMKALAEKQATLHVQHPIYIGPDSARRVWQH